LRPLEAAAAAERSAFSILAQIGALTPSRPNAFRQPHRLLPSLLRATQAGRRQGSAPPIGCRASGSPYPALAPDAGLRCHKCPFFAFGQVNFGRKSLEAQGVSPFRPCSSSRPDRPAGISGRHDATAGNHSAKVVRDRSGRVHAAWLDAARPGKGTAVLYRSGVQDPARY
jgi:hypothetical protein